MQDNVLKPCSLRTLSRALLAVAWVMDRRKIREYEAE